MTAYKPSHLVPKLRFPEFREAGEWEERLVGDVFKVTRGEVLAMPLVRDSRSNETPFPVYSSQTKNRGLAGYYSEYLYEDAITWTTDGANAGDVNYRTGKFYCTNVCGVLINNDGQANLCTAELINSVSRQHVSFVGNPKLMNGVMSKIAVPFPKPAEQQKIADCLGSLDDLIAAEGRKLEALRQHKQGLMQQLFPQAGETVPRLRFPEFEDAGPWEQLTIDEAADFKNGYAFKSETYVESGDFQIVTIGNVQEGRLDLESTKSIATLPRDIQNHQILKPADILVSMTGNVGRVCLVPVDGLLLNQRVGKLIPRRIDHDFFFQMLSRNEFRSAMQLAAAGGAQRNVSAGEIKSFAFARPVDPKEQRGIADCLSPLDTQIAAQVRKLDALRQHKQGLLQHLFPSLDGQ